jgi:hypothetical protein
MIDHTACGSRCQGRHEIILLAAEEHGGQIEEVRLKNGERRK